MLEYKVSQEQSELYEEALVCLDLNCGTVLESMSNSLSESELNKFKVSTTLFVKKCEIISDELKSRVIKDIDNLQHIRRALEYYRDLIDHTKYVCTNMYEFDIMQKIIAKDMLISQNLFRIKQHLRTTKL